MFVGHLGAALALKRADRRVDLGLLVAAAFGPDLLLWALVMPGIETVVVPPDYASRRYLMFNFPYSHGVAADLLWALLVFVAAWRIPGLGAAGRARGALVIAGAVLTHTFLDALVHVPGLPILGAGSP